VRPAGAQPAPLQTVAGPQGTVHVANPTAAYLALAVANWRAELAIRLGVIYRKACSGRWTWAGARAQPVLMSVWWTCWQQGRSAVDFLSQLLRGPLAALTLPW
jgi:transposase